MNNKYIKSGVRAVVKFSTMIAVNDMFAISGHKIARRIAGLAVGYMVGNMAADAAEKALDIIIENIAEV